MLLSFGLRRGEYLDIREAIKEVGNPLKADEVKTFETFDLFYHSLCSMLFNYVPPSGHPGGSISSGRFVAGILFDAMDYDLSDPDRKDADMISYAAGHKALGLCASRHRGIGGRPGHIPGPGRY
jgi:transketolase